MSLTKKFLTLQRKVDRMIKMKESTISKNYKKTLDELRITMARMYEEYEIDGQLTFEEMSKYNRLQKLDKEVYDLVTGLYKDNSKIIRGTLRGIITTSYTNTLDIVQNGTEKKLKAIQKPLDVTKTINTEMSGLKWTERLHHGRSNAIYEVQKEIKRGLTQGDTYSTMTKRLKKALETDVVKANRIIRTESHRCFNQAKMDSLEDISKQGVKLKKKWVSSRDERVRGQHSQMDGVSVPVNDNFMLPDGAEGKSPGLIGEPQHDINCRCIVTVDIIAD